MEKKLPAFIPKVKKKDIKKIKKIANKKQVRI